MSIRAQLTSAPNFVSFSSPAPLPTASAPSPQIPSAPLNPKSILYDSAETRYVRLRTFANQLKHSIESAKSRTGSDESDHAIEHIYQVATQQHLFVDYRPDNSMDPSQTHPTPTNAFLTQTFYGKLYIDEVYVSSGQGTNKKFCKRHCFQQALDRLLAGTFEVTSVANKDGRQRYELTESIPQEDLPAFDPNGSRDRDSFSVPAHHPMANTKMNFVQARDTSTIAGRIAWQQNKLEQQYWQQLGQRVPSIAKPRRMPRSFSPPPPIPHQTTPQSAMNTIEAVSTTPASVAVRLLCSSSFCMHMTRLACDCRHGRGGSTARTERSAKEHSRRTSKGRMRKRYRITNSDPSFENSLRKNQDLAHGIMHRSLSLSLSAIDNKCPRISLGFW